MGTDLNTSTINTNDRKPSEERDQVNDVYEDSFASSGCFSRLLCFKWRWRRNNSSSIEHVSLLEEQKRQESWWMNKLKSVKESSELLAGPKWKTFIRRFNNNRREKPQFQYDPHSYALNFDCGASRGFSGMYGPDFARDPPASHLSR